TSVESSARSRGPEPLPGRRIPALAKTAICFNLKISGFTRPSGTIMRTLTAQSTLTLFGLTGLATAEEVTLRAVTSFAEKTTYSRGFERFIDRVNDAGKGVIHINYIGGPKAMPPFEVGNALKNGVIDM